MSELCMPTFTPQQLSTELWVPFMMGVTPYAVSSLGRVRKDDDTQRICQYCYIHNDRPKVRLFYRKEPGGAKFLSVVSVAKLVADNFLPEEKLPLIRHLDGNNSNCAVYNLEWANYQRTKPLAVQVSKEMQKIFEKAGGGYEKAYNLGYICWDQLLVLHDRAKKADKTIDDLTATRRPDHPDDVLLPVYRRRSIPKAEWEAMQKSAPSAPAPAKAPFPYEITWEVGEDANGAAIAPPFIKYPPKQPDEGPDDIEESGLYFSQARYVEGAYTVLVQNKNRTEEEEKLLKNIRRVLDY